jgi:hypothetical protein
VLLMMIMLSVNSSHIPADSKGLEQLMPFHSNSLPRKLLVERCLFDVSPWFAALPKINEISYALLALHASTKRTHNIFEQFHCLKAQ